MRVSRPERSAICVIIHNSKKERRTVHSRASLSTQQSRNQRDWTNIEHLAPHDEVKFVIGDRVDYDFAVETMKKYSFQEQVWAVLFSAVFVQATGLEIAGHPGLALETLARWILDDGLGVILQPQIHKFIWDPGTRGV